MMKFFIVAIAAAIVLGIALNVLGTGTEVMASSSPVIGKADRLDVRSNEASCGSWPFYHNACPQDLKNTAVHARKVRVISQIKQRHRTLLTLFSK